ncbi:MAG: GIY-YIG nuclease family protein [Ignavibacteriales bacterium]
MKENASYYVYIVQCADGNLYTGTAKDLHSRIDKHNQGQGAKYTRGRLPVTLVYSEKVDSKSEALKREMAIKWMTRPAKLALIKSNQN